MRHRRSSTPAPDHAPVARRLTVTTARELGEVVRAVRKAQGLRQDEIASVSHKYIGEAERGKPTAQVGKLLELLQELGIRVTLEVPMDISRADARTDSP